MHEVRSPGFKAQHIKLLRNYKETTTNNLLQHKFLEGCLTSRNALQLNLLGRVTPDEFLQLNLLRRVNLEHLKYISFLA